MAPHGAPRGPAEDAPGRLSATTENARVLEVWRGSLQRHGWIEGKNLLVDYRYSEGHAERLPALAAELVALKPDVIVTSAAPPTLAAQAATSTVPIVFVGRPVEIGLVNSLSRPGGNVTGLATVVPGNFLGKRLELLRQIVPSASSIALLLNPNNADHRDIAPDELPRTARALGIALPIVEARTPEDLDAAFAAAAARHVDRKSPARKAC